jgi:putrescine aminotransferase
VSSSAALENIRIIQGEDLVNKVARDTGPYLKEQFGALLGHPLVGHADSCGFVAGLNLVRAKGKTVFDNIVFDGDDGVGMICRGYMFSNGIIMRAVGDRMIIAPPLVMTRADIDEMIKRIRAALDDTLAELKKRGLAG